MANTCIFTKANHLLVFLYSFDCFHESGTLYQQETSFLIRELEIWETVSHKGNFSKKFSKKVTNLTVSWNKDDFLLRKLEINIFFQNKQNVDLHVLKDGLGVI